MSDDKKASQDGPAAVSTQDGPAAVIAKAPSRPSDATGRTERQAEELRRNLQRRKAQQRQRRGQD